MSVGAASMSRQSHMGRSSVEGVKGGRARIGVLSPDPAHARSILTPDENRAKEASKHAKGAKKAARPKAGGWFALPHELGDPDKSGLTCDVTSSHVEYDLELTGPGDHPSPAGGERVQSPAADQRKPPAR